MEEQLIHNNSTFSNHRRYVFDLHIFQLLDNQVHIGALERNVVVFRVDLRLLFRRHIISRRLQQMNPNPVVKQPAIGYNTINDCLWKTKRKTEWRTECSVPSSFEVERRGPFDEDEIEDLLVELDWFYDRFADEWYMIQREQRQCCCFSSHVSLFLVWWFDFDWMNGLVLDEIVISISCVMRRGAYIGYL